MNPARAQAAGADSNAASAGSNLRADPLEVRVPDRPRQIVGVADVMTETRPFAANITESRHDVDRSPDPSKWLSFGRGDTLARPPMPVNFRSDRHLAGSTAAPDAGSLTLARYG